MLKGKGGAGDPDPEMHNLTVGNLESILGKPANEITTIDIANIYCDDNLCNNIIIRVDNQHGNQIPINNRTLEYYNLNYQNSNLNITILDPVALSSQRSSIRSTTATSTSHSDGINFRAPPMGANIYHSTNNLNAEQISWIIFKTIKNLGALNFEQVVNFFINNRCKLLVSIDNNKMNRGMINKFISYNSISRDGIVSYLFNNSSNIKYFICPDNSNIFFYNEEILNQLLEKINEYSIFINYLTINQLLELSCVWNGNRDPIENYLIHILFGSTNKCGWKSEHNDAILNLDLKDGDSDRILRLKLAYESFLNM